MIGGGWFFTGFIEKLRNASINFGAPATGAGVKTMVAEIPRDMVHCCHIARDRCNTIRTKTVVAFSLIGTKTVHVSGASLHAVVTGEIALRYYVVP